MNEDRNEQENDECDILSCTVIMGKKYASIEFISVLIPALCDGCALWCMLDSKIMPSLPSNTTKQNTTSTKTKTKTKTKTNKSSSSQSSNNDTLEEVHGNMSGSTTTVVSLRDLQDLASKCLVTIFKYISEARADVLELAFQKRGTFKN